jgi:hypothetical protein
MPEEMCRNGIENFLPLVNNVTGDRLEFITKSRVENCTVKSNLEIKHGPLTITETHSGDCKKREYAFNSPEYRKFFLCRNDATESIMNTNEVVTSLDNLNEEIAELEDQQPQDGRSTQNSVPPSETKNCKQVSIFQHLTDADTLNSSGKPLSNAAAILQQDRYYVNAKGRLDKFDKIDEYFTSKELRSAYGKMISGQLPLRLEKLITQRPLNLPLEVVLEVCSEKNEISIISIKEFSKENERSEEAISEEQPIADSGELVENNTSSNIAKPSQSDDKNDKYYPYRSKYRAYIEDLTNDEFIYCRALALSLRIDTLSYAGTFDEDSLMINLQENTSEEKRRTLSPDILEQTQRRIMDMLAKRAPNLSKRVTNISDLIEKDCGGAKIISSVPKTSASVETQQNLYQASLSCRFNGAHTMIFPCFDETDLKITRNGISKIYKSYDLNSFGRHDNAGFHFSLPSSFEVRAQNGSDYMILNLEIRDANGELVFQDEVSQYGVIKVGN